MYSEEQLKNKDFFKSIKKKCDDIVIYGEFREAYDLAKELEESIKKFSGLKEQYYDLYLSYKKIIIRLKWIGLPIMTESRAVDMFKFHFNEIYKIPDFNYNDLWRNIKSILLVITVFEERDKFKGELRKALSQNEENITSKRLIINSEEKKSTIGNWIRDYNFELGTDLVDNLKRTQYFTVGKNFKNLDSEEKKKVRLLLDIYERLKLSSLTLEGLEEDIPVDDDGRKGIIKGGIFEPLSQEAEGDSRMKELNLMLGQYPPASLERKAIEEEIERLNH
jgi:hypothetical protein